MGKDGRFPPMPSAEATYDAQNTVGAHLAALRKDGFNVDEFAGPEAPDGITYIVEWFTELSSARANTGFGLAAITYQDIDSWARLTGRTLTPFEVAALRAIDAAYLKVVRNAGESIRDH